MGIVTLLLDAIGVTEEVNRDPKVAAIDRAIKARIADFERTPPPGCRGSGSVEQFRDVYLKTFADVQELEKEKLGWQLAAGIKARLRATRAGAGE